MPCVRDSYNDNSQEALRFANETNSIRLSPIEPVVAISRLLAVQVAKSRLRQAWQMVGYGPNTTAAE